MKINFLVNPVFDGWNPDDERLGGTEESVVEWATRIAAKGFDVTVYHNQRTPIKEYNGVKYRPREEYRGGDGKTINIKSSDVAPQEPTWYLTNETDIGRLNLRAYDGVILPSKWAWESLQVQHPNIQILPHGYDDSKIYPVKKIKNQCLYASSPDRGLSELEHLWPQVVEQVPDATLIVTYNGWIDTPNTLCLGDVDNDLMNNLFNTSQFWVYPCLGGELYCMSGIKAQVAKAIPVYYPTMALQETVTWGIKVHPDTFVQKLVKAMQSDSYKHEILARTSKEEYPTWDSTTEHLLRIINVKPWLR